MQISACLFHWHQALERQMAKKGLSRMLKISERFRHGFRLLKGLAFVPAEHVHEAYQAIMTQYFDVYAEVIFYSILRWRHPSYKIFLSVEHRFFSIFFFDF